MSKLVSERLPMNLAIHSLPQRSVPLNARRAGISGAIRSPILWALMSLGLLTLVADPVRLNAADKVRAPLHSPARATQKPRESQPVPGYRYYLVSLSFLQPRRMSTGAGNTPYTSAIEIQLDLLDDDREHSTPAVPALITLNGYSTSRTTVKDNGLHVTAWLFGVTLQQLEAAARAQGGWSLEYQPRLNSSPLYRISPNGRLNALENRPVILSEVR